MKLEFIFIYFLKIFDNGNAIDDIKDEDDNVNDDDEAQSFINNEKMFLIKIFFTPLGMFYF